MRQKSTLVALFFLVFGALAAFVVHLALASLFGVLRVNNTMIADAFPLSGVIGVVVGMGAAFAAFSMGRTKTLVGEVLDELNKVNWPSGAETRMNTAIVVVFSVVCAVILGVFDITFGSLSNWLADQNIRF